MHEDSSNPEPDSGTERVRLSIDNRIALGVLLVMTVNLVWNVLQEMRAPPSAEPILEVIGREAEAAVSGDWEAAAELYAEEAIVRSISPPGVWRGKSEIRNRYMQLPDFLELSHVAATVDFDRAGIYARARSGMIGTYRDREGKIHSISSYHGEEWSFEKVNGEWKIRELVYGLD